ncbi:11192_t:CDS:2, partial [Ambispora leptoticha]
SYIVVRLPVHLDGQQNIYFDKESDIPSTLEKGQHTKLTRYFDLCKNNPDYEKIQNLRYIDMPNIIFRKIIIGFEDIRTIEGVRYKTFKEAAAQIRLADDDDECDKYLKEAVTHKIPIQLKQLFASIIIYYQPANLKEL